jgi:hypothetical protein
LSTGAYKNRKLFRDNVSSRVWAATVLMVVGFWLLVALDGYAWLPAAIVGLLVVWQVGHAGVWAGEDDILIAHPVWGRRRVRWDEIERFDVKPFNQWMIAWVITRTRGEIPCQGISSGRKRTQRVDVVVEQLNDILRERSSSEPLGSAGT